MKKFLVLAAITISGIIVGGFSTQANAATQYERQQLATLALFAEPSLNLNVLYLAR